MSQKFSERVDFDSVLGVEHDAPPTETAPGRPDDSSGSGRLGSVFVASVSVCALFVAWGVLFTENLNSVTTDTLNWVTATLRLVLSGRDPGDPGVPGLPRLQPVRRDPARQGHRPPGVLERSPGSR